MFGLYRKKRKNNFLNNRNFILNRENYSYQTFEAPKTTNELEKHLIKLPVENFSSESSGVDITKEKLEPVIENTNSKALDQFNKSVFTAKNLTNDETQVPPQIKRQPIDSQFIVTHKDANDICPVVEQNLISTQFSSHKNSKKRKKNVYDLI